MTGIQQIEMELKRQGLSSPAAGTEIIDYLMYPHRWLKPRIVIAG
jgi:hypothetical protein